MKKKRILIFIDWFYPGFRGGGPIVSILNLVREIYKDFDLYIFTSAFDYKTNEPYQRVTCDEWTDFQDIARVFYATKKSFSHFFKEIRTVRPDVIYLNNMFSLYFTILPILYNHFGAKKSVEKIVLAPRGMLLPGKLQFKNIKKIGFLRIFKTLNLQKKLILHVTDSEEKAAVISNLKIENDQVFLIPNIPTGNLIEEYQIARKKDKELKIYFSSRIAREKNILFVLNVLNQVKFPVELGIFGVIDHPEYWDKCLKLIQKMPDNISVKYRGEYTPGEMKNKFTDYHAFIFPTFGENYGHVIIEALSLGKPVITTPNMPWVEIENAKGGWIIDLKNKQRYLKVLNLLFEMEQNEYNLYSKAAFNYARKALTQTNYRALYNNLFS